MEDDSEQVVLMGKYKLLQKIGSGSFGSIYMCQNIQNKEKLAVKLQKKGKGEGQLQYEIKLYQIFQGINGISRMHDYGIEKQRLFMVIDLLAHSLEDLFQKNDKHFSISTTINIGLQIINRLEMIHRKGFLHRDIKANNFMVGKREKSNTVYIIDFGLAKRYKDLKTGKHIPFKSGKSLVGTARYASIASHQGFEQCRRDDLESLAYLLFYFIRGRLPWQGIQIPNKVQKYAEIGRMKKQTDFYELCEEICPRARVIAKYYYAAQQIEFEQEPNYDALRKILKQDLIKHNQQNKPLDWDRSVPRGQRKERVKRYK